MLINSPDFKEFWNNLEDFLTQDGLFDEACNIKKVIKACSVHPTQAAAQSNKKAESPFRSPGQNRKSKNLEERSLFGSIKFVSIYVNREQYRFCSSSRIHVACILSCVTIICCRTHTYLRV